MSGQPFESRDPYATCNECSLGGTGRIIVTCDFEFEAAHYLPNVPPDHKCRRVHGHNYQVSLHVTGPLDQTTGWIIDFADVGKLWAPAASLVDHSLLNDIPGLANPTAESLAAWIWERLEWPDPPRYEDHAVIAVEVAETASTRALFVAPGVTPWVPGHLSAQSRTDRN